MFTRELIIQFASAQPECTVFTTQILLPLSTRGAIDNVMCQLVDENVVERLAWGVFRLSGEYWGKELREATYEEIAEAKTQAFTREVLVETREDETDEQSKTNVKFRVSGFSSTFRRFFGSRDKWTLVKLSEISLRKATVTKKEMGKILYSIWQAGELALEKSADIGIIRIPRSQFYRLPHWMRKGLHYSFS